MVALVLMAAAAVSCTVELRVEPAAASFDLTRTMVVPSDKFVVRLNNTGTKPVTLVEPGDGSKDGRRTPIVTWEGEFSGGAYVEPKHLGCGNINTLTADEVFVLAPGESRTLGAWVPPLYFEKSGSYTLRLKYKNDPGLEWQGVPLGEHDAAAMKRVRGSTPCSVVSNDVVLEITGR